MGVTVYHSRIVLGSCKHLPGDKEKEVVAFKLYVTPYYTTSSNYEIALGSNRVKKSVKMG